MRAHASRSEDGGATWSDPVPLHGAGALGIRKPQSPSSCHRGGFIATGYAFRRPDAHTPHRRSRHQRDLAARQQATAIPTTKRPQAGRRAERAFSRGGRAARAFGAGHSCLCRRPAHRRRGALSSGCNGPRRLADRKRRRGRNLARASRCSSGRRGGAVAPWECRICHLGAGRVAVLFWAFDAAARLQPRQVISRSPRTAARASGPSSARDRRAGFRLAALGPDVC